MADRRPFTTLVPAMADELRRTGVDLHKLDLDTERMLTLIYNLLPVPPVSRYGRLAALATSDGVDHITRLPDDLLRNIVSRLPVKDAARTTVLASRWRTLWLSTPLVLIDADLLPKGQWPPTPANSPSITTAVSHILEAHLGPLPCVYLLCSRMSAYRAQLTRWLHILAAKGVQDLVLVNRPWPRDVPLPAKVFTITTLTLLYLGMWKLPDMAVLRGVSFPHLRELGLCSVEMEQGDVDRLVMGCPVLEILNIQGCCGRMKGLRIHLVSQSLRCVQICISIVEKIDVVDAPCLDRLIISGAGSPDRALPIRFRIGDAPKLHAFGFLDPRNHLLEIRDTMITAEMKVSRMTMVTSVKFLSLNVRFGVHDDIKLVATFLRCFPNVERLHITSEQCDQSADDLILKFWEESGPIESVLSRINMMTFRDFRGEQSEVGFLEFFFQSARVLKTTVIVMANPSFTPFSVDKASSKVKEL
ncbi:hypothetical protein ACQ4PT_028270 [Festuca glaucescens]